MNEEYKQKKWNRRTLEPRKHCVHDSISRLSAEDLFMYLNRSYLNELLVSFGYSRLVVVVLTFVHAGCRGVNIANHIAVRRLTPI